MGGAKISTNKKYTPHKHLGLPEAQAVSFFVGSRHSGRQGLLQVSKMQVCVAFYKCVSMIRNSHNHVRRILGAGVLKTEWHIPIVYSIRVSLSFSYLWWLATSEKAKQMYNVEKTYLSVTQAW